jgi:hypothetical protein
VNSDTRQGKQLFFPNQESSHPNAIQEYYKRPQQNQNYNYALEQPVDPQIYHVQASYQVENRPQYPQQQFPQSPQNYYKPGYNQEQPNYNPNYIAGQHFQNNYPPNNYPYYPAQPYPGPRPPYPPQNNGIGQTFQNILNNLGIRGPNGGYPDIGAFGGQISRALDEIVRNDDQQCVPKLICMMTNNPRQSYTSNLPYVGRNVMKMLLMAIPNSNSLLSFSKAALLGYSIGDNSCDSAYPQCPRDEERLLHYLNNHKGGFFRFFNQPNGNGQNNYGGPNTYNGQNNYNKYNGNYY